MKKLFELTDNYNLEETPVATEFHWKKFPSATKILRSPWFQFLWISVKQNSTQLQLHLRHCSSNSNIRPCLSATCHAGIDYPASVKFGRLIDFQLHSMIDWWNCVFSWWLLGMIHSHFWLIRIFIFLDRYTHVYPLQAQRIFLKIEERIQKFLLFLTDWFRLLRMILFARNLHLNIPHKQGFIFFQSCIFDYTLVIIR